MTLKELVTQGARKIRNTAATAAIGTALLAGAQDAQAQTPQLLCTTTPTSAQVGQTRGPHTQPMPVHVLGEENFEAYGTLRVQGDKAVVYNLEGEQTSLPATKVRFEMPDEQHRINLHNRQPTEKTPQAVTYDLSNIVNTTPQQTTTTNEGDVQQWKIDGQGNYMGRVEDGQFQSSSLICLDVHGQQQREQESGQERQRHTQGSQKPRGDTHDSHNHDHTERGKEKYSISGGISADISDAIIQNKQGIPERRELRDEQETVGVFGRFNYQSSVGDITITGAHQVGTLTQTQPEAGFVVDAELSRTILEASLARELRDNGLGMQGTYTFEQDKAENVRLRGTSATGRNDNTRNQHTITLGPAYKEGGFVASLGAGIYARQHKNIMNEPRTTGLALRADARLNQDWLALGISATRAGEQASRIAAEAGVQLTFDNGVGIYGGVGMQARRANEEHFKEVNHRPYVNVGATMRFGKK